MIDIVKFRFAGLWHSEYPLVANRLISIIGQYDVDALHLKKSYDRLATFAPLLAKIEVQERANSQSATLNELDQQRDTPFNVIVSTTKAFAKTAIVELSAAGTLLTSIIKKHGADIATANYTAETERLNDFIADVENNPAAVEALTTLSLKAVFEEMKKANTAFDKLFMERNQQVAETEKVDVRAIRQECDKAISAFWNALEFCAEEYGDTLYLPMLNVINEFNSYYKQQLAARATRRKTKNVSNEEPIEIR
jgi:uncharacterized protein YdcH (DUF465 family)